MTPPSSILAPDRERASAAAWGTLCLLAIVQIALAAKLLIARNPLDRTAHVPVPAANVKSSVVPEIGQIAAPTTAVAPVFAPPAPGTLSTSPAPVPSMAPPVATSPPPIGSFQQMNGAGIPAVPAPVRSSSSAPPSFTPSTAAPPPSAPTKLPPAVPGASSSSSKPAATMPAPMPAKADSATELLRDVNYVVTAAKETRGMGDMNGTLEMLRRADELTPDHPAIIAEMAQTYEQMGVAAKATDNWRRIQLLGPTKAGSFFELASRRLGAGPAAAAVTTNAPSIEGDKVLRLGACQPVRDFAVNSGERYTVRVPILRAGSQPVDARAVNLEVFFFDRVNGTKIAQSIAAEPVETWQSAPVDWTSSTGEETLDVVYHLPALSDAEIQQHGQRSYYGYMLRLYYNNKLQDVAAEPRDLLGFGSVPGAPAGMNPLLPPAGR